MDLNVVEHLFMWTSRLYKLLSSYCVIIFYGLAKATFTALKPYPLPLVRHQPK
jgi:hypothetical protein